MNRREFLRSAMVATVGLPLVVADANGNVPAGNNRFEGLPENRDFEMPEAPNLSKYFRDNAGGVLRIERDSFLTNCRRKISLSGDVQSYVVKMNGGSLGVYTVYFGTTGVKRDFCGRLPERGKLGVKYVNVDRETGRLIATGSDGFAEPLNLSF